MTNFSQTQLTAVAHLETTDNVDSWDGYDANRRRVLDTISENKIDNVIVISGDSQYVTPRSLPPGSCSHQRELGI